MDDATLKSVAARFTAARKAKGLQQKDIAEAAGVSTTTISTFENGKSMPQRSTRAAITRALGEDVFDDDLADEAMLGWPDDVQVYIKVVGGYLAALPPDKRAAVMGRWMAEMTGQAT
jgi:transcriptional regulator with XRE-family HTH domain